jgi:hypothetical protein
MSDLLERVAQSFDFVCCCPGEINCTCKIDAAREAANVIADWVENESIEWMGPAEEVNSTIADELRTLASKEEADE